MPVPPNQRSLAKRRRPLVRADWLLSGLAVLGLILYVWQYRQQDPDSTVRYALSEEQLVDRAAVYLMRNQYDTGGLTPRVALRRYTELLQTLQYAEGRQGTVQILKTDAAEQLPAYHWRVEWRGSNADGDQETRYIVRLTQDGNVFGFDNLTQSNLLGQVNRAARAAVRRTLRNERRDDGLISIGDTDSMRVRDLLAVEQDSTLRLDRMMDRRLNEIRRREGPGRPPQPPDSVMRFRSGLDSTVFLSMARYHLEQTPFAAQAFTVDSVWIPTDRGNGTAGVRFASVEPLHGQDTRVDIGVSLSGILFDMEAKFDVQGETPTTLTDGGSDEVVQEAELEMDLSMGVSMSVLVLLVIAYIVVFFRRLGVRAIDASAALRDAIVLGLMGGASVFLTAFMNVESGTEEAWHPYLITGIAAVFAGLGIAALVFLVSGATDSGAREVWSGKLRTLSLVRQGSVWNKPVGRALLRGLALAFVLNGLFMLVLSLSFGRIAHGDYSMLYDRVLSPASAMFSGAAWSGFMHLAVVLLGVVTFVQRKKAVPWLVIGAGTALFGFLMINPVTLQPFSVALVSSLLLGLALVMAFWQYDFLTCFVGYLFYLVVWVVSPGWAVEGSPLAVDMGVTVAAMAAVAVVGFIGVRSGKPGDEIPAYVPNYIVELSRQERLTRELEIARHVQMSFLPRRMPRVEGLDVAAMCLAAQEVGGDYYDFVKLEPHRLAIIIGDVSGKGIQAAFYMTLAKGFFRTLCRETDSPAEVLRRMNRLFYENVERGTFISVIYGIIDLSARTFTFSRAGHNPVILKRSPSQKPDIIQPIGLALGLVPDDRFDRTIEEQTVSLRTGDVLVFYTDGFTEAMNSAKEMYGDARLARKVADVGQYTADGILRVISEDVHRFVEQAGRHDDMTMVVIKMGHPINTEIQAPTAAAGSSAAEA